MCMAQNCVLNLDTFRSQAWLLHIVAVLLQCCHIGARQYILMCSVYISLRSTGRFAKCSCCDAGELVCPGCLYWILGMRDTQGGWIRGAARGPASSFGVPYQSQKSKSKISSRTVSQNRLAECRLMLADVSWWVVCCSGHPGVSSCTCTILQIRRTAGCWAMVFPMFIGVPQPWPSPFPTSTLGRTATHWIHQHWRHIGS